MEIQYDLIGQRIKLRRKERNIKQADMAEHLGISNNHMSSIENGRQKPSLEMLLSICDYLQVTPDYILLGNMHADDVPQDIMEGLRICSTPDLIFFRDMLELFIERNQKNCLFTQTHCKNLFFSLKCYYPSRQIKKGETMRILVCDDDSVIIERLTKYIKEYFNHNNLKCPELATFHSGESMLCDTGKKDIVFLDIEMPGISGISTGAELKRQNPNIIIFIVTSYMEYLDEAMRFHVYRYLSKPIDKKRLFRNLREALQLYSSLTATIAVETKQGVYSVPTSSILFVEARERKVIIHTQETDYRSVHNIEYWANILNKNCFFRSHRSFIINMKHVTDFDHTVIHLGKQNDTAYLTKRKYTEFKQAYLFYLENTSLL